MKYLTLALVGALSACGGGGDSSGTSNQPEQTATLSGKAATGAALKGSVVAVNAKGEKSDATAVDSSGLYKITINNVPPFFIKATSNNKKAADGKPLTLYSYAEKSGVANVTELTTYALHKASQKGNLNTIFDNWSSQTGRFTIQKVEDAAQSTLLDFGRQFKAAGVTKAPDIFKTDFKTDGTGIDKVLDVLDISYTCSSPNSCGVTANANGALITGNTYTDTQKNQLMSEWFVDTSGMNLPHPAGTGKDTVRVTIATSFDNVSPTAGTTITVNGMTKPSSRSEFCSDAEKYAKQNKQSQYTIKVVSCEFGGNTGKMKTQVGFSQFGASVKQYNHYTFEYL